MKRSSDRTAFLYLGICALASCDGGGGSSGTRAGTTTNRPLQAEAGPSGGGQDAAANASFFASGGVTVLHGNRPRFVSAAPVADALRIAAESSLQAWSLESGAGPHLLWSARNERLAADPSAPKDGNDNGTNRDETLAAEWAKFEDLVEGRLPAGIWPAFALFRDADPRFAGAVDVKQRRSDFTTLRWDRAKTVPAFTSVGLGGETLARVLRAETLLAERRGNAPGLTVEQGFFGLLYLQQALALEELLLRDLAYDGVVLGTLETPESYDPAKGLRWFCAAVAVKEEAQQKGLPPKPAAFTPTEPASELAAQAALLQGFAELAWLAAPTQTNPNYRDLFQGRPFGKLPDKGKGNTSPAAGPSGLSRSEPGPTPAAEITFDQHIKGFTVRWGCASCHGGEGGLFVTTYAELLRGGNHQATNPMVVPGNAEGSLFWQIIALANPPVARRMPDGGPILAPAEINLIRDWIDQGAKEKASAPSPAPAVPGRAVARVIVRNLAAMHRDDVAGVLVDRHDGKSKSVHVDAAAAGAALAAMAAAMEVVADETALQPMLQMEADFVANQIVQPSGEVRAGLTLGKGPDALPATLDAQAAVVHGLFEAARVTASATHRDAALRAGNFLLHEFWKGPTLLFETTLGSPSRAFTPELIGKVLAALRDLKGDGGVDEAGAVHDQFASAIKAVLVLAEWDEAGEVIGDGDRDTNKNGIPEAPAAGGQYGTSTVFAGRVVAGPVPPDGPQPALVSWSRHVQPLFRMACAQCHMNTQLPQGHYSLDTWVGAGTHGDSGGQWPMIVPGDPAASLLFQKLDRRNPPVGVQMPQALPPLTASGRALVAEWIRQGALNN